MTVTDFGIARAGASDMTHTGSIMGTAQYLSPEQAQGQPVSAASDIYAIGVLLFELLTGRVPFDGESAVAIALQHLSSGAARAECRQPRCAERARSGRAARTREGPRRSATRTRASSSTRSKACADRLSPRRPPGQYAPALAAGAIAGAAAALAETAAYAGTHAGRHERRARRSRR